jgi:polyhydroxyalkanoate synthase subunit PhaC
VRDPGTCVEAHNTISIRNPHASLADCVPTEFAPPNPGLLGLWTLARRTSGAYFDPAIVPLFFGNLPTDLASQVPNLGAPAQAAAVGTVTRPFGPFGRGFNVYDVALREIRELAGRDVFARSWLAVSKRGDDAAPFPGETFRRWWGDFYERDKLVKGKTRLRGHRVDFSDIGCAVLNASGEWDCTVPPLRPGLRLIAPAARTRSTCSAFRDTWAC